VKYYVLYDKFLTTLAYPAVCLLYVLYVWFPPFAMIINLLMWADVRNTHAHQDDGGSAT